MRRQILKRRGGVPPMVATQVPPAKKVCSYFVLRWASAALNESDAGFPRDQ